MDMDGQVVDMKQQYERQDTPMELSSLLFLFVFSSVLADVSPSEELKACFEDVGSQSKLVKTSCT